MDTTATTPELTEAQRIALQNIVQRIALSQLATELARLEHERASRDLLAFVQGAEIAGWTLDLATGTFTEGAERPSWIPEFKLPTG